MSGEEVPKKGSTLGRAVIVLAAAIVVVVAAWGVWAVFIQERALATGDESGEVADSEQAFAPGLDVIASATRQEDTWEVQGRVLDSGDFVEGARVWLIGADGSGQRVSPRGVATNEMGEFLIDSVPVQIGTGSMEGNVVLTVFARTAEDTLATPPDTVRTAGTELFVSAMRHVSNQEVSTTALALILGIFVLSILVALVETGSQSFNKAKYYLAIALAFGLTAVMIGSISIAIRNVPTVASNTDVLSLGFGRVYKGTYVDGVQPEWVFSFTSPASEFSLSAVDAGFGAPLWVILLAVVGAGLFTVSLIVQQVQKPISELTGRETEDVTTLRDRVGEVVQHQFYILFAPLGGVVVYQLQVAAGAASNQVVVGLAALAAGLAVNLVLERALRTVTELVKGARGGS